MRKITKRTAVIAIVGAIALGSAGAAYAFWIANAEGTATAVAEEVAEDSLTAEATVIGPLYPGSTNAVEITVENKNDFPVSLTGVTFEAPETTTTGCAASSLVMTAKQLSTVKTVDAKTGTTPGKVTFEVAGAAGMAPGAFNACQGATFTVGVTVKGQVGNGAENAS